jgi:anti-anti-sigma regulatory factor
MSDKLFAKRKREKLILKLNERFEYSSFWEFRKIVMYFIKLKEAKVLELDFEKVVYIHSSLLGMLLAFKDICELSYKKIVLVNLKGPIADIFGAVNFQNEFSIKITNEKK